MNLKNHLLIAVEGCRGVGKGTFCEALRYALMEDNYTVCNTTEPTKGMYGQNAILRLSKGENDIETTLLFCLDRKQHVEALQEQLSPRTIIICDRYSPSTLVYQPEEHGPRIIDLHKFIPRPDLTILIDADHEDWVSGNMEAFVTQRLYNRKVGDRSGLRRGDKDPQVYNAFRKRYIEAVTGGIVDEHMIIHGFRDSNEMVADVMYKIKSLHSDKFGVNWRA